MPWLTDLAAALRSGGIGYDERPGWQTRGHGPMGTVRGVLIHHTAGGGSNDWKVVQDGRPGLEGPLAQMVFNRNGGVTIIAAGQAWHAGAGNHPAVGGGSNATLIGIEGVSRGVGNDWTPEQRREYPRVVAALCRHYRLPASAVLGHKEFATPRGRKIDPGDWDMNQFRTEVQRHLTGGTAPAPAPSGPPADGHHVVVAGDTLWGLAQRYSASVDALRAWNGLSGDHLAIMQRLRVIPPPTPVPTSGGRRQHTVAAGETLYRIGLRYDVDVETIKVANGLRTDLIGVGQRLIIPAALPAPAPKPPPPPAPAPVPSPAPTPGPPDDAAQVLRAHGIVADPGEVIESARAAGLELAVQAAKLVRESYGGKNVFGNDRVDYPTSGAYTADTVEVTRPAVDAYFAWVAASGGRNRNGVGPSQLTWSGWQDLAEQRGGIHLPLVNMTVGAEIVAGHLRKANGSLRDAGTLYNGGKPYDHPDLEERHREYGRWFENAVGQWRTWLGAHNTKVKLPVPAPPPSTPEPDAAAIVAALRAVADQLADYLSRKA